MRREELGKGMGDPRSGRPAWGGRHWPGAGVRGWAVRDAEGNQISKMRNQARVLQAEPTLSFVRPKMSRNHWIGLNTRD
jgi:hypothetical protein